jgi:hypothetical protein
MAFTNRAALEATVQYLSNIKLERPSFKQIVQILAWILYVQFIIWLPILYTHHKGVLEILKNVGLGMCIGYCVIGFVVFWTYYVRSLRWRSKHEADFSWKEERMFIIIHSIGSVVLYHILWPWFISIWNGFKKKPST